MKTKSLRILSLIVISLMLIGLIACARGAVEVGIHGIYLEMPQEEFLAHTEKNALGFTENSTPLFPTTIRYTSTNFSWLGDHFEANTAILDEKVQHFALLNDRYASALTAVTLYKHVEKELKSKYGAPDREVGAGNNPEFLIEQIEKGETMYAYCRWENIGLQHSILGDKGGEEGISISIVFMTANFTRLLPHF